MHLGHVTPRLPFRKSLSVLKKLLTQTSLITPKRKAKKGTGTESASSPSFSSPSPSLSSSSPFQITFIVFFGVVVFLLFSSLLLPLRLPFLLGLLLQISSDPFPHPFTVTSRFVLRCCFGIVKSSMGTHSVAPHPRGEGRGGAQSASAPWRPSCAAAST